MVTTDKEHAAMQNGDHVNVPLPPGDDNFEEQDNNGDQHAGPQQYGPAVNPGFQQWNVPPWYPPYGPQQLHVAPRPQPQPHRANLKPLWTHNVRTWFSLAEATFEQCNVSDSRMKFNLVLTALSEDTLERVKAIVNMPEQQANPYLALRARLFEIYEPDEWESAARLLHMRELGDMKPSQLMDAMLALLPEDESPGVLFKAVFLARLPGDMRDHVQAHARRLGPQELAHLADTIWQSRNAAKANVLASLRTGPTPTSANESAEDLEETVAALNINKRQQPVKKNFKRPQLRKAEQKGRKSQLVCWKHLQYGKDAYNCADVDNCSYPAGN